MDKKPKRVIVYTTPSCSFCGNLKTYLHEKGVEFEEYDVSKDQEKLKEMLRKTGSGSVPVTDIEGKVIVGFDPEKIEKALNAIMVARSTLIRNLIFDPFDQ
jgi:glutaredoxin-like YruB-family protein